MGRYFPSHQSAIRSAYQGEAGFSLWPPRIDALRGGLAAAGQVHDHAPAGALAGDGIAVGGVHRPLVTARGPWPVAERGRPGQSTGTAGCAACPTSSVLAAPPSLADSCRDGGGEGASHHLASGPRGGRRGGVNAGSPGSRRVHASRSSSRLNCCQVRRPGRRILGHRHLRRVPPGLEHGGQVVAPEREPDRGRRGAGGHLSFQPVSWRSAACSVAFSADAAGRAASSLGTIVPASESVTLVCSAAKSAQSSPAWHRR